MTAVLGGGISGLSAAYYALDNPKLGALTLLEASNRIGGWIKSCQSTSGGIFEKGPRTVRPRSVEGKNTLDLIDNLELTDKIIPISSSHPAAKNRLIYVDKKLHILPNSFGDLFKIKSPFRRPLITMLWTDFRAPKVEKDDESVYSFVERRLGKDVADYIISPMLCGICAGDAQNISVNFLMNSFFQAEQQHGSITKGIIKKTKETTAENKQKMLLSKMDDENIESKSAKRARIEKWAVWGLDGGLEQLPKSLAERLTSHKTNIRLNSRCEDITFKPDCVELKVNGEIETYSQVISSLAAKDLGVLLRRQHPQLARELEAIPTVTVGVVNFKFENNILPMEAFGLLIPPKEKLPILGIIFDSCVFPQESSTVLTVMMGGAWFDHYFGQNPTEDNLKNVALQQVKNILKTKDDPSDVDVAILKDCIPQYIVGHQQRLHHIHNYISSHEIPLALCGSSYNGVGINDVILSAKNAIQNISQLES